MSIDLWANFLFNEKLDPRILDEEDTLLLIELAQCAAEIRGPRVKPHKDKLLSREFLCEKAIDLGIDLPAIKNRHGKVAMGRGLLDAWNKVYTKRFGSTVGTASRMEAIRRDIKTRLCNQGIKGCRLKSS